MSQDNIFEIALSLPQPERADLASQLLRSLEREGADNHAINEEFDLASVIRDVQEITQELFPGKCEFTHEFDPEYPDDRYVVVNVEAQGEPKELVDRSCQWDERIRQVPGYVFGKLRISIVPR
jgi:hypothetical protein